jgi:hypothetical protein
VLHLTICHLLHLTICHTQYCHLLHLTICHTQYCHLLHLTICHTQYCHLLHLTICHTQYCYLLHLSTKLCYSIRDGKTLMPTDFSLSSLNKEQDMYRSSGRCLTLKFAFVTLTVMSNRGRVSAETFMWINRLQPSGHYVYSPVVTICTAQWSLYALHSGHYMYRRVLHSQILRSAHTAVFMCFVWIWERTAIIFLYNINWLVFITETECVYCAVRTGCLYTIQVNNKYAPINTTVLRPPTCRSTE